MTFSVIFEAQGADPTRERELIQMGTVPQEVCTATTRQCGENVIPRFREDAEGK